MIQRRALLLTTLISSAIVSVGCGGSDDSDSQRAVDFRGVYRPTPGGEQGDIGAVAFTADQGYLLMPRSCQDASCAERGTFAFNARTNELSLTSATTNETRTIDVRILKTDKVGNGATLTPKNLVSGETKLVEGDDKLTEGNQKLTDGDKRLVEATQQLLELISSANVGGQDMNRDDKADEKGAGAVAANCTTGIPTGHTSPADVAAYWARCPKGIFT